MYISSIGLIHYVFYVILKNVVRLGLFYYHKTKNKQKQYIYIYIYRYIYIVFDYSINGKNKSTDYTITKNNHYDSPNLEDCI